MKGPRLGTLALLGTLFLSSFGIACQEPCLAAALSDCHGGTHIVVKLGPGSEGPADEELWIFELDVEGEQLRVECDLPGSCDDGFAPNEAEGKVWAILRSDHSEEGLYLHVQAGYFYSSTENASVTLLPRDIRVTITDPQGVVRTQVWTYSPNHAGADTVCWRCELAQEIVELSQMSGRPND